MRYQGSEGLLDAAGQNAFVISLTKSQLDDLKADDEIVPSQIYRIDDASGLHIAVGTAGDAYTVFSALPPEGTSGQVLALSLALEPTWSTFTAVPRAGLTGQVLGKISDAGGDVDWLTIPTVPTDGSDGQVLTWSDGSLAWNSPSYVPTGGEIGQVLTVSTEGDFVWADPVAPASVHHFVGEIRMVSFEDTPSGWALCDGLPLSASAYPDLFSVIGYTYGGADGTFALPNMSARVPVGTYSGVYELGQTGGADSVTLEAGNLPSHNHGATLLVKSDVNYGGTSAAPGDGSFLGVVTDADASPHLYVPGAFSSDGTDHPLGGLSVGYAGSSDPVDIRSPYIGVRYIIALTGNLPV